MPWMFSVYMLNLYFLYKETHFNCIDKILQEYRPAFYTIIITCIMLYKYFYLQNDYNDDYSTEVNKVFSIPCFWFLSPEIFPSFTIFLFPDSGHHSRFWTTPYTTHPNNNISYRFIHHIPNIVNESVGFVMVGVGGVRCCSESRVVARILKMVNCKRRIHYGAWFLIFLKWSTESSRVTEHCLPYVLTESRSRLLADNNKRCSLVAQKMYKGTSLALQVL